LSPSKDGTTGNGEARPAGDWILVVDDDGGLCELASRILERKGHAVGTAARGAEALDLILKSPPALMIVDYRLPDMTGQDLVVSLGERGLSVPFVMMTGQGDERLAVEIMKLGAADYLIKDTDLIDRLPAAADRVLKSAELKRRLLEAEEGLKLAANVYLHSREGILITDAKAEIIDVNPAFTEITGYGRGEILGKNPRVLNSGRQTAEFYSAMWETLRAKGHWTGEVWNRRKDGALFAELLSISSVLDERGDTKNYIAQFSDITTLKEYQGQLERIAHYDALTGLPNRLLLADRMIQAMAQAPRRGMHVAIAYLDLDGFKAVNDRYGHETGDMLLAALATRMQQSLRDGDTLARLGGDEFVAVLVDLPEVDSSGAILSRLLDAVSLPVRVGDVTLQVSASLGVAAYPQSDEVDADQLLRQADQAMYQAKQAGKNRFHVFDAEYDRNVRGRYESLKRIEAALKNGEFILHYQPKVNMRTGAVAGAEALIRWNHPTQGLLAPAEFLPVLENHPLSVELGEWVIDTALAQIEAWHREGLDIPVSVNVSAFQLQHPDFPARLRELMDGHATVGHGELELEILETSALEKIDAVSGLMSACDRIGLDFALDDFGTGYSSLLYLKRLPAKRIKIDQSFIRDILDNPEDLAILEGVVGLASAFRRTLVAEGVETVAHGEILLCMGCEWAQGFAIARPMAAADLPEWIRSWKAPERWKSLEPVGRQGLSALYAAIEHRAWVRAAERFLTGELDSPPNAEAHGCPFCSWLEKGDRRAPPERPGDPNESDWPAIETLHREIHDLVGEAVALKEANRTERRGELVAELCRLGDALFERMGTLYWGGATEGPENP